MDETQIATAQRCLTSAYEGTLDFAAIVRTLMAAGFESYTVDYRREVACYYLADGDSVELALPKTAGGVAPELAAAAVEQAVRDAQSNAAGYTYPGFCARVKAAGCAGYMVSFTGRRVVYFGRTAEIHVEHFPRPASA